MPSEPDAREPPLVRTTNCVECHYGREHTICHVLHLLDDEWVIEHRPRGRVGASDRYLSRPIAVVDYDPRWAASFRAERRLILAALDGWCLPLARPSLAYSVQILARAVSPVAQDCGQVP